ncbi:MAG: hypothetical protein D6717_09430 [Gammaproteobacteria bacterium]|nr:MAG: hypothetical protein D6717_09430 [Gammaproteobacteria bacterium]
MIEPELKKKLLERMFSSLDYARKFPNITAERWKAWKKHYSILRKTRRKMWIGKVGISQTRRKDGG